MFRFALLVLLLVCVVARADGPIRLVSKDKEKILRAYLPEGDSWLKDLKSKHLIFYTLDEMPECHQDWSSGLIGIHSRLYNISAAQPQEKYGNPNIEFPWGNPAGTKISGDDGSFHFTFMYVPENSHITWWREYLTYDRSAPSYKWSFPEGTIFGEALCLEDKSDHRGHCFELRLRIKTNNKWEPRVYKPDLALMDERPKSSDKSSTMKGTERQLDMKDRFGVFNQTMIVTRVNNDHRMLAQLLKIPFKVVHGNESSYTTKKDYDIVPKDYLPIRVSQKSCMQCHNTVQKHADELEHPRDWYGYVRGSDNIFSFHIFDPSCISYSGFYIEPRINPIFKSILKSR